MLDIVHDVIINDFPELILDNFPDTFLETYPKELLEKYPPETLNSGEFKIHFKEKLPNELIMDNGKKFIPDMPTITFEDIVINLEFQSYEVNFGQEAKFNVYQAYLHKEHKKHVITVVFSTVAPKHELITHKINSYDGFTMLIISLKALNQKQSLNNSLYKNMNDIFMSDKEKALFLLSPMMDKDKRVERLKEIIQLTPKIRNLSTEEFKNMIQIELNYAKSWFDKEIMENNGGNNMAILTKEAQEHIDNLLTKEEKEKYREEGKEIGEEKGIEKVIKAMNMIKKGFTMEDTIKATGLTEMQINQLCIFK